MGKRQKFVKRPNNKQNSAKSKSITPVAQKGRKESNKQSTPGKTLFKIVNENEEEQDDFNALGNN